MYAHTHAYAYTNKFRTQKLDIKRSNKKVKTINLIITLIFSSFRINC